MKGDKFMFDKIELPYEYNALEPYIDEETVKYHYGKHLQKYLDTLNGVVKEHPGFFENKTLADVLISIDELPEDIRNIVKNNAGGVYNHNLYFAMFSPNHNQSPKGELLKAIERDFGSLEFLKEEMSKTAISVFGSGYAFLVKDKEGNLTIRATANQNVPICKDHMPILALDVWEHAYYLKYKNLRPDYVNNYWNLIDWEKVEGLYKDGRI